MDDGDPSLDGGGSPVRLGPAGRKKLRGAGFSCERHV
jgi:hypothetical protein